MKRFFCAAFLTLISLSFSPASAQQREKPLPALSCTADTTTMSQDDSLHLTVSLENRGSSDFYIYHALEWGWAGIGYTLTNERGDVARPRELIVPLPPPPVNDKSKLVGLAPGYFYGTRLAFDLSHYVLSPGVYYVEISYRSNYRTESGLGLPILTFDDGEFKCDKIQIQVRPN
jgi:hypothetical protein